MGQLKALGNNIFHRLRNAQYQLGLTESRSYQMVEPPADDAGIKLGMFEHVDPVYREYVLRGTVGRRHKRGVQKVDAAAANGEWQNHRDADPAQAWTQHVVRDVLLRKLK